MSVSKMDRIPDVEFYNYLKNIIKTWKYRSSAQGTIRLECNPGGGRPDLVIDIRNLTLGENIKCGSLVKCKGLRPEFIEIRLR